MVPPSGRSENYRSQRTDKASSSSYEHTESQNLEKYGPRINDSLIMVYKPQSPHTVCIDIIFFHGLELERNSDILHSTWSSGNISQEVWPKKWLPKRYPGARIIFALYDAYIGVTGRDGMMDLELIAEKLWWDMRQFRQEIECPIILVGHSFGGLVIQQLCVKVGGDAEKPDNKRFLQLLRGICFYSTPHEGMNEVADHSSEKNLFAPNKGLLRYVKILSKEAGRLRQAFEENWKAYQWKIYSVGETHVTAEQSTLLVQEASSRFGDEYLPVESDHFGTSRPISESSDIYLFLCHLIDLFYEKTQDGGQQQSKREWTLGNRVVK